MLSPMIKNKAGQGGPASDRCSETIAGNAQTDSSVMSKDCSSPKPDMSSSLPLQWVDDNNKCTDLSARDEKVIRLPSSSSMLVAINWSDELLKKYNTQCLENLPEVFNGPVTKKARSEPLSLYTCLEAFLREEPLVPEDMWYSLSPPPRLCTCYKYYAENAFI